MGVKPKRVSSFLKKRREERLNLSQVSNDQEVSPNASLLNLTDGGLSYEDRKLNFGLDLQGSKTQRISIIDGIEDFTKEKKYESLTGRGREDSMTIIEEVENQDSQRKKSRKLGILAISAGLLAGGLIYLIKKKRFF